MKMYKRILCVPFDPVHDVGIKIIRNELSKRDYETELLPPDLSPEQIVKIAAKGNYDFILVSRTIGYGVAELLAKLIDMLDASGVRKKSKIVIGGKPITPELAAELGFDMGFGEHSTIEDLVAYIEGKEMVSIQKGLKRQKPEFVSKYNYDFFDKEIEDLLLIITEKLFKFIKNKTSPGIERAKIKEEIFQTDDYHTRLKLRERYLSYCDDEIIQSIRERKHIKNVREISIEELNQLDEFIRKRDSINPKSIQSKNSHPFTFKFLGSGCPIMDLIHGKICERYGINGFLIINPSWEARYEGLLEGYLTHENDGTITSFENIKLIKSHLDQSTLLSIRAHRGLNTPETVLLAGLAGADLVKINLVYGSLGAGTDPIRLAVDGIEAIKLSAHFNIPFDIPGNDELSGVPAYKTLAGLLINLMIGKKLGAKPILKPLFCYGPHIVINDLMKQNFIDYNAAKIFALRRIVHAPIWPGEPIAFMTQSEERVQSANSTAFHAALAASLQVDAITIASTDEAYSRGPISIASRIDTINAVTDAFRFLGDGSFKTTSKAEYYADEFINKIKATLLKVIEKDNLTEAIFDGVLGDAQDGAYPGTFGRETVIEK